MKTTLTNINKLPVPTWKWLHINSMDVNAFPLQPVLNSDICFINQTGGIIIEESVDERNRSSSSVLADTIHFVQKQKNHALTITVPENMQIEDAIELHYLLDEQNFSLISQLQIIMEPGSSAVFHISYKNGGKSTAFHAGHIQLDIKENANLQLNQIQMLSDRDVHVDAIECNIASFASADLLLSELGGRQIVGGCDIHLQGHKAKANLDSIYIGNQSSKKDLNYRIEFKEKETEGVISAKGALSGKAVKNFKSTIDFISGATGAKGREEETVLVLDEQVKNVSTPLLLCGEDNVEGQHATNIGRPDPDKLYYLMSRGFSEPDARRLLVKASFIPVLEKISSDSLKQEILARIEEVVYDE